MTTTNVPKLDLDLFTDEALSNPYPLYEAIRDHAPGVYLPKHEVWAIGRYEEVRASLLDWETFSSAQGVGISKASNNTTKGIIIATDPPEHDRLRAVLSDKLSPRALRSLKESIAAQADALVESLVTRGDFDAVADLARAFPLKVVLDLVGLPDSFRPKVLDWADAAFNAGGPDSKRTREAQPLLEEQFAMLAELDPDSLTPGSFGKVIYEAAENGLIERESCVPLMSAYVTAGLDTTINAISHAVQIFAERPQDWERIRAEPALIPAALNEVLRIESPVMWFSRVTTRDVEMGETYIPAGERVLMLFGSANRDERKWERPNEFLLDRNPVDHVAFGYGVHGCAGQGLARLEAVSLLTALARRVERFEIGAPVRRLNNRIRGLASLPTHVIPA